MSKDESRRRFRDHFPFKSRKEKSGPSLPVPISNHTLTDPSILPPSGGIPSTSHTRPALSLNVVQVLSQSRGNTALKKISDQDPGEACSERLSEPAMRKSMVIEPSLWALAYDSLQKKDPELIKRFNFCLGIISTDTDNGNLVFPSLDGIVQQALEKLKSKEKLNKTSTAIRKYFEQAVKVIIASKDFISSAVSANPYAALAWTGVSLLLPLLLNPTQENEAAIKGLDYIANLIVVYRWQEKIYLHNDDAGSDFKDLVIRLYTTIFEYEATLLVYKHQKPSKQWVKDVFQAGGWSSLVTSIQLHDANCKDVTNAISGVRAKEWRDEERRWQDNLLQQPRQDKERLHIRKLYSNYEAGKNVNPERISGTCEWFLSHTGFLTWRESQSSSLLWLSADPGCGKSVLAKYLIDRRGEVLTVNTELPTVCYFFFKDGDVERIDGAKAICAFIHQLILQQPHLYRYAKEDFQNKNDKFLTDFDALWNIFLKSAENASGREIICVLDALDECQAHSGKALTAKLVQLYSLRGSTNSRKPILKFLVTSRPEFGIVRDFKDLTRTLSEVRLRGEEESEQISREIDLVICYRVEELGLKMDLSESDKLDLRKNLSSTPHRTYLWLYLTFDAIAKQLEFTKDEIADIAKTIPKDVDQAYTAILDKSPNRERARRLLHIVLAATRPLTLQEMNVAMVMEEHHKDHKDLDIWQRDVSEDKIKNMCGLFLSVVDSKVYLIHQTAREFLVCKKYTDSSSAPQAFSSATWKESFLLTQSNLLLAKICIWYLQLRDFEGEGLEPAGPRMKKEDVRRYKEEYYFLSYAAQHWAAHFTQANSLPESMLIDTVAYKTCDTLSRSFKIWFSIYTKAIHRADFSYGATNLLIVSYFGHDVVVKLLLEEKGVQVNLKDNYGRTPLWWAAAAGHEAVVRLLLEREDIQVNLKDDSSNLTPLTLAAARGHEAVVKLLLERDDVQVNLNEEGQTPLWWAAWHGYEAVVKLLLEREDVQADSKNNDGQTPLSLAAEGGHEAVVKLLLERDDVETNSKENLSDGTPLSWAAKRGHEAVVRLLLEREDVQVNLRDKDGKTPLSSAVANGHKVVVKLLLEREEIQADLKKNYDRRPLAMAISRAAREGKEAMIRLLEQHVKDLRLPIDYSGIWSWSRE